MTSPHDPRRGRPIAFEPLQREECGVLGIQITPLARPEFLARVEARLASNEVTLVAGHNLHSAYIYHSDDEFRTFYDRADFVLADGFPVLLAHRAFREAGRHRSRHASDRIGSTDWIPSLGDMQSLRRLLVVGARPESNRAFLDYLQARSPDAEFRGVPADPWTDEVEAEMLQALREFKPQMTLLGLGMPLQEQVLLRHMERLTSGIYATVGGAIDQLSGVQTLAPRWIGRLGLEWVWRLVHDPRRLADRYLVEPWKLAWLLARRSVLTQAPR